MITEKSAGAIIWRKQKSQLEYLMIQSQPYKQFPSAWGFTKGHLEGTESNEDAAQNYKEFSYKELQLILKKANNYLLSKIK